MLMCFQLTVKKARMFASDTANQIEWMFSILKTIIMQIQKNCVVSMHYTLKDDSGNVLDSSEGREPLSFLQGAHNIIRGLEDALEGHTTGDKLEVTVEPKDGYGVVQEHLIQQVPKEAFAAIPNLEVGMRLQAETEQGPVPVMVSAIEETHVTVDGNHELAGAHLHFSIEITDVREATQEEIDHGHAH